MQKKKTVQNEYGVFISSLQLASVFRFSKNAFENLSWSCDHFFTIHHFSHVHVCLRHMAKNKLKWFINLINFRLVFLSDGFYDYYKSSQSIKLSFEFIWTIKTKSRLIFFEEKIFFFFLISFSHRNGLIFMESLTSLFVCKQNKHMANPWTR